MPIRAPRCLGSGRALLFPEDILQRVCFEPVSGDQLIEVDFQPNIANQLTGTLSFHIKATLEWREVQIFDMRHERRIADEPAAREKPSSLLAFSHMLKTILSRLSTPNHDRRTRLESRTANTKEG